MESKKVGIIAGTLVDTKMGVDFFTSKGLTAFGYPVSLSPEEQSKLQILSPIELKENIRGIINKIKKDGISNVIVYCNSLAAAVDMEKLSVEEDIRIVSPFNAYKTIAGQFSYIGVLTANNQSSAGIEKIMLASNPKCHVIGIGILKLAIEIEKGTPTELIIEKFGLRSLMEFYNTVNVDVIILGCTHFPYLHNELQKHSVVPILDPAELMYEILTK